MNRAVPPLLALCLAATAASAQDAPPRTEGDLAGEVFARMDSNRDGELSLEEFEKGIARPFGSQREGVVYQKLPARFRALDADASSFLEAGEYAGLARDWQGGGAAPSLAQADDNHDGRVDFREFARVHAPRAADADASATPPEATAAAKPR